MKKTLLKNMMIPLFIVTSIVFAKCDKENEDRTNFNFPDIENINLHIYEEIQKTCDTYWELEDMIDSTFEIVIDGDGFIVHCDGNINGELYHFEIRTDDTGKWINDKRTIVKTSDEFLDITHIINYNDFESIKTYILSNGDKQTYSNMYNDNPHYSFNGFETYLNPDIGQRNGNCDPDISDFNEIVIRDRSSDPQYFHLLIVRSGDIVNEQIFRIKTNMIEGKIYLLEYYEPSYDLQIVANKVKFYINKMKTSIDQ